MRLYCDNKSAISITHNPIQHDRTKHVKIDRHFIKEKLENGLIWTPFIPTGGQLANVLTKVLSGHLYHKILSKIEMHDIHSPS